MFLNMLVSCGQYIFSRNYCNNDNKRIEELHTVNENFDDTSGITLWLTLILRKIHRVTLLISRNEMISFQVKYLCNIVIITILGDTNTVFLSIFFINLKP